MMPEGAKTMTALHHALLVAPSPHDGQETYTRWYHGLRAEALKSGESVGGIDEPSAARTTSLSASGYIPPTTATKRSPRAKCLASLPSCMHTPASCGVMSCCDEGLCAGHL